MFTGGGGGDADRELRSFGDRVSSRYLPLSETYLLTTYRMYVSTYLLPVHGTCVVPLDLFVLHAVASVLRTYIRK